MNEPKTQLQALRDSIAKHDIPQALRAELLATVDWHEARVKRKYGIQEPTPGTARLITPTCANPSIKFHCGTCGALVPVQVGYEKPWYYFPEICECGRRLFTPPDNE